MRCGVLLYTDINQVQRRFTSVLITRSGADHGRAPRRLTDPGPAADHRQMMVGAGGRAARAPRHGFRAATMTSAFPPTSTCRVETLVTSPTGRRFARRPQSITICRWRCRPRLLPPGPFGSSPPCCRLRPASRAAPRSPSLRVPRIWLIFPSASSFTRLLLVVCCKCVGLRQAPWTTGASSASRVGPRSVPYRRACPPISACRGVSAVFPLRPSAQCARVDVLVHEVVVLLRSEQRRYVSPEPGVETIWRIGADAGISSRSRWT